MTLVEKDFHVNTLPEIMTLEELHLFVEALDVVNDYIFNSSNDISVQDILTKINPSIKDMNWFHKLIDLSEKGKASSEVLDSLRRDVLLMDKVKVRVPFNPTKAFVNVLYDKVSKIVSKRFVLDFDIVPSIGLNFEMVLSGFLLKVSPEERIKSYLLTNKLV